VGIVTSVQGVRWYELTITGRDSHAGTTPMTRRADAMAACARVTLAVRDIARRASSMAVGTIGRVEVSPNSPNVIPGVVVMTVDIREHTDAVIAQMHEEVQAAIATIATEEGVTIDVRETNNTPVTIFHPTCIDAVRVAADNLGLASREIVSGAGHDAVHMAKIAPSAMIFIPCKDGLSHNEAESSTFEDCAAGAQVLLEAAIALDQKLGAGEKL
jgi:N-carbamoyl-L-amino-acid hydrolase